MISDLNMNVHRCREIKVTTYCANHHIVVSLIHGLDGDYKETQITLYDLPKSVTTKLLLAFGDDDTRDLTERMRAELGETHDDEEKLNDAAA